MVWRGHDRGFVVDKSGCGSGEPRTVKIIGIERKVAHYNEEEMCDTFFHRREHTSMLTLTALWVSDVVLSLGRICIIVNGGSAWSGRIAGFNVTASGMGM